MLSETQFYYLYTDFDIVITGMNEKLLKFKSKNPDFDESESLNTINNLRNLQHHFHKLYHFCQVIDGQQGRFNGERQRLLNRIAELEKENENLKTNII